MALSMKGLYEKLSMNDTQHNNALLCAECHYAECHYAECHYAECHYAECHYAECHYAECRILFCYADCRYAGCRYAELLLKKKNNLELFSNFS